MRVGFFAFLVAALVAFASANAALTSRPKETAFQVAKKSLQKIKHVIVLMMENRSFDHLLGWMKEDTNKNVDGLSSGMTCPRDPNDSSKGELALNRAGFDVSPDDPRHDYKHIAVQMNGGAMNGFVSDAINEHQTESNPISMFDKFNAPIINTLAQEFAVFDDWYCSVPGPTDPNRAFAMAGTSLGVLTNFNGTLWNQQSYFDYLRQNGHSFGGYHQDDLWALLYFEDTNKPPNSQYMKDLDSNFYNDLKSGDFPEFVWLQPRTTTYDSKVSSWQHPDASVLEGERLIKDVYEAIRASDIWNSTLFLITYDEHGGFYDHVAPPTEGVPSPDGSIDVATGYNFESLGVRVPTIAISPYISKGTVVNSKTLSKVDHPTKTSQFDSTSILATTNLILNISAPPLGDRMGWAATFTSILATDADPRDDCLVTLPDVPSVQSVWFDKADGAQMNRYEVQRSKPLNDHLEAQLLFYCMRNNDNVEDQQKCIAYVNEHCTTQGAASDWIRDQKSIYTTKLRAAEADYLARSQL